MNDQKRLNVCVIEDDDFQLKDIVEHLERSHYMVKSFKHADHANEYISKLTEHDRDRFFDVVFSDLKFNPENNNEACLNLIRNIRQHDVSVIRKLKVYVITVDTSESVLGEVMGAGGCAVIDKLETALYEEMEDYLDEILGEEEPYRFFRGKYLKTRHGTVALKRREYDLLRHLSTKRDQGSTIEDVVRFIENDEDARESIVPSKGNINRFHQMTSRLKKTMKKKLGIVDYSGMEFRRGKYYFQEPPGSRK